MTETPQRRDGTDTAGVPEAAVAELRRGNKIAAIKLVRVAHGVGLKEAKDAVDEYLRSHPEIDAAARANAQGSGALWWSIAIVLIAVALWLLAGRS